MNLKEKIEVAKCLERLKVDVIEACFATGDFESVQKIAETIKDCSVASIVRATIKDIDCAYEAVKRNYDSRIHLFIAISPLHMEYKLKMTPYEVLQKTAAMMLRYSFNLNNEANVLETLVNEVLNEGYRTADIANDNENIFTCTQMTEKIIEKLSV